ncbi:uncharacterized protein C8R40DRAFT_1168942 [Lentinula edodes]|uniref:uncharacterized protein n=1 Tax=Lentinula edodes TaxID=5353 RepID=UPI001E8EE168|nr:uncharacterized protein C8R40DRAFT_1168942 [Lentinula edodes]KAH7877019.1 hypothetical protein C8R40DRAFT_1168942 [Lentinula edodes]
MSSVLQLLSALSTSSECAEISFAHLDQFIHFARHLQPEISLGTLKSDTPPTSLPEHVQVFLSRTLEMPISTIVSLWSSLRQYIWGIPQPHITLLECSLFNEHGSQLPKKHEKIAFYMFYPPHTRCPCCNSVLTSISHIAATYFTRDGPFPAYSTSLRCKAGSCNIRYYLNFSVDLSLNLRQYYDQPLPEIIHLKEHSFIQTAVSELFTACTLFAWVSAQNCALIYNHALSSYGHEEVSESKFMLTSTQVWRAFVLVSLLKNWRERGRQLTMQNHGQPERLHACDTCKKLIPSDLPNSYKELRSLCAVVMDGVTIGHPCCKVHNCTQPLPNNRHQWSRSGHRTCSEPDHSKYEDYRNLKGKGFFLLRQRLQRAGIHQPSTSLSSFSPLESLEFELDVDSDEQDLMHKSDKGNWPSKAFFARRRTHNAQLVVCACGIISARATMFGAEAISGVKDFLKSVYPNRNDLPDVIFYDNNCHLQSHLQAQQDLFFRGTMLPVDVFHFKSKHKESDEFCQKHCNPLQWTELVGDNGEWVFNSSAAEQGNVWIGGYQAIVHEMLPHNYNFFLDEMIKRRNEVLVAKLRRAGNAPYRIPPYPAVL